MSRVDRRVFQRNAIASLKPLIGTDEFAAKVGKRIRAMRVARGFSLRGFRVVTGLNPWHVGAIERGEMAPTLTTLTKIAQGLGVSAVDLLNHSPEADPLAHVIDLLRSNPELAAIARARCTH